MVYGAVLLGILWASHRVAFDAPFYFDTKAHLEGKTNLHLTELTPAALRDALRFDFGQAGVYRPVAYLSLALNHYAGGLAPAGYRVANLGIHALACLSLVFLFQSVCAAPRVRAAHPDLARRCGWAAFLAAALWALHPIQTNVTTYVIQRMTSLSGLFTFLAVGCYLRARGRERGLSWGWAAGSLACFAAAAGSKESAVVILPLVLLAEATVLAPPASPTVRKVLLVLAATAVGVGVGLFLWAGADTWKFLERLSELRAFSPLERFLTQVRLQPWYAVLLLVPDPRLLTLAADVPVSQGLLSPPTTALAALAVLGSLLLGLLWRRSRPLWSLGLLWFFAAQLVEGTFLPLELYFEHRMYVPSVFLYFGISCLFLQAAGNPGWVRVAAASLVALFLTGEVLATHARNLVWADPVRFWQDNVAKAPRLARGYTNLGNALVGAGQYREAEEILGLAKALEKGEKATILVNLATAAYHLGDRAKARAFLDEAIALGEGDSWTAFRGRATLHLQEGRYDEAEADAKNALRLRRTDGESWYLLATAKLLQGELGDGLEAARRSVRYAPRDPQAWNTLGALHYKQKEYGEAIEAFQRAVDLAPDNPEFRRNRDNVTREGRQTRPGPE